MNKRGAKCCGRYGLIIGEGGQRLVALSTQTTTGPLVFSAAIQKRPFLSAKSWTCWYISAPTVQGGKSSFCVPRSKTGKWHGVCQEDSSSASYCLHPRGCYHTINAVSMSTLLLPVCTVSWPTSVPPVPRIRFQILNRREFVPSEGFLFLDLRCRFFNMRCSIQ
jgi:hypothetical protein